MEEERTQVTNIEAAALRQRMGLSQRALATFLGVSQATVARRELGADQVPEVVGMLLRYLAAYGLPETAFASRHGIPSGTPAELVIAYAAEFGTLSEIMA